MLENQKVRKLKEKIDRNKRTVADGTSMLMALTPDVSTEDGDAAMRSKVLNGTIRIGIADAGASSSCGQSKLFDCGGFSIDSDLFNPTGRKSSKIFQYAGGAIAAADDINKFKFNVRHAANEVHMVPGIKNTLISTNQFAKENYAWV